MSEQNSERRWKLLGITPEFLLDLFKNEDPITISFKGLPPDARFAGMHVNVEHQWIDLVIESEAFPVVPEGCALIRFDVTATEHRPSIRRI